MPQPFLLAVLSLLSTCLLLMESITDSSLKIKSKIKWANKLYKTISPLKPNTCHFIM